jgi:hypothetical protein
MNPLHLVLIMLPVYICLQLEIEDTSNLYFRHIGDVAGTVGMAHILMIVNITQRLELMNQLCTLLINVHKVDEVTLEQTNLLETLESHCQTLLGALIEREGLWFNLFNQ